MNATLKPLLTSTTAVPPAIERLVDDAGICHLIFNSPGSSVNVFTAESMRLLDEHLSWIEETPNLCGLVLRSAKSKNFVAGADLAAMLKTEPDEIRTLISRGQQVFNRLENLPLPKVAAIHGACLGGGFEVALACDYRIASDDPSTRIGLPETQLGLIPAWGGSTRLPRLIGVRAACDVILKGNQLPAKFALKRGLIDAVVPPHALITQAVKWLLHSAAPVRRNHWDHLASPIIRSLISRTLQRTTHNNYPAMRAALDVVTRAPWRSLLHSLQAECDAVTALFAQPEVHQLIRLFFARERARKLSWPGNPAKIAKVAIIGAGVMGCGIAYWLSTRGLAVLLLDVNVTALAVAEKRLRASCQDAMRRHLLTQSEGQAVMDRIVLALNDVPLDKCDLIIEAAVEEPAVKRKLFSDILLRSNPKALLTTNTSALPLSGMLDQPNFVGLHFFNPVHAMPLVEIVRPAHASDDAVATAVNFVQAIGKLPLIVMDSPGFLVNRVLMPYLLEAAHMVHSGASVASIDEAMLAFGMPMGPLRLLDEVGLDVAMHVAHTLFKNFPTLAADCGWLEERVKSGALGRKSGHGFYRYSGDRALLVKDARQLNPADIAAATQRLPLLLTNEAAHCLDEGIAESAAHVDLGMVLGTGYAPFRGGPLRYADAVGLEVVLRTLRTLAAEFGERYSPASGLIQRVTDLQNYYPERHTP